MIARVAPVRGRRKGDRYRALMELAIAASNAGWRIKDRSAPALLWQWLVRLGEDQWWTGGGWLPPRTDPRAGKPEPASAVTPPGPRPAPDGPAPAGIASAPRPPSPGYPAGPQIVLDRLSAIGRPLRGSVAHGRRRSPSARCSATARAPRPPRLGRGQGEDANQARHVGLGRDGAPGLPRGQPTPCPKGRTVHVVIVDPAGEQWKNAPRLDGAHRGLDNFWTPDEAA